MSNPFTFRKPPSYYWILFFLFFAFSCKKEAVDNPLPSDAGSSPYSLTPKRIKLTDHINGYYEYLPQGYSTDAAGTTYPLLIFFHGGAEIGQDSAALSKLLINGPLKFVQNKTFPVSFAVNGKSHKFIIIAPQFAASDDSYAAEVDRLIEYAKQNYKVDNSRIYLSGLSVGGGISWNYVGNNANYARKIAAVVPVAAYINEFRNEFHISPGKAQIIANSNLPIWSTHNRGDNVAALSWTEDAQKLVKNFNPNPSLRLTVFNSNTHEGWTLTYDPSFKENGMNIYEWMLQFSR